MSSETTFDPSPALASVAQEARHAYVERIAGGFAAVPWWTAVIVTASSARQAGRYSQEILRRREQGKVPGDVEYLVVPDIQDQRIGSGGATLNALRLLAGRLALRGGELEEWWARQRVLMIHAGGDSRRLPEYSLSGRLFSVLPIKTPWGEVSTVFDETLALSTAWARQAAPGLVVSSGDVLLTFRAEQLAWQRPGVCGVAIRQPAAVGAEHGVYVLDEAGRVYSFLQKPSAAQVRAAGGMLENEQVAVDTGLLHFDAALSARLTVLGHGLFGQPPPPPPIDLYEHITFALTGQWSPAREDAPAWHALAGALRGVPFWCSLAPGDFTHVGTTSHFRRLIAEESKLTQLYAAHQRLGTVAPPNLHCAGVIVDSVFSAGGVLGPGAIAIECDLQVPVRAGRAAILHGLSDLPAAIEVPDDTVVHQVPVVLPDGRRGAVVRVYGVGDNPQGNETDGDGRWFGRPMPEVLRELGIDLEAAWPGVPPAERTLWNAQLYVAGTIAEASACAPWMMGFPGDYSAERWARAEKLSLASSAQLADHQAIADARGRRMQANWQLTGLALARAGSDLRPLLAHAPGITPLAKTGRALLAEAAGLEAAALTEAASRYFYAGLFFGQAGLEKDAAQARSAAFRCVQQAVITGVPRNPFAVKHGGWRQDFVCVSAPPRIDLGGGWSDTPPFCLDWGGTVLNMAITVNGVYPIRAAMRRIPEPVVRCISGESGESAEYRVNDDILAPMAPGSGLAIPRAALQLAGIARRDVPLQEQLARYGGGLEIRTAAELPMGSGLGTSSILAAAVLRALAEMLGLQITESAVVEQVLMLEQMMTTGGGWQDQAGGIFPGAKLILSGPGLRQRLRVEPIVWSEARRTEFAERFVFYYTGIRRIAKDLLAQVVGSYLAREVATVQVLHSLKTLAVEMAYALQEGEWEYLGQLLDRHWQLNQVLDPHTTNAPINALLEELRPWLAGAKLAGAGGGGFLMLLAKGPEEGRRLRERLAAASPLLPGALYDCDIASDGLRVTRQTSGKE